MKNGTHHEIYTMKADDSAQTPLTDNSSVDGSLAWSPDGRSIAFNSDRDGTDHEVFRMDSDGSDETQLTFNATNDFFPSWQPLR